MWRRAGASTNPPVGVKSREVAGKACEGETGRGLKRGEWRGEWKGDEEAEGEELCEGGG